MSTLPDWPDFCWPVDTACIPDWDDVDSDGAPVYTVDQKARAVAFAGQVLRMLTAYRIGGCPVTIRPCRARCGEATWRTYPAMGPGSTPWQPVHLGGRWLNIGCGHGGACSCTTTHSIPLQAGAVVEVRVDGAVLDPSAYRLDVGYLVRVDGQGWPLCQNLDAPDTEEGTWSVSYVPGEPVDRLGAVAAGLMAREYLAACTDGSCALPTGVTQIVRQGVTLTLGVGAFPDGRTGIREVDAWLESVNPYGLRTQPRVFSVDRPRARGMRSQTPFSPNYGGTIDGGTP